MILPNAPNGLDVINPKKYAITPALKLILRAREESKNRPYFLILDEMNLSHVERYFADILSAIESEDEIPLYEGIERSAFPDASAEKEKVLIPNKLKLPKNLFIIGTVNVDETTYQFSPKVLDRANVIEFRMTETDMRRFLENPIKPYLDALAGQGVPKIYRQSHRVTALR